MHMIGRAGTTAIRGFDVPISRLMTSTMSRPDVQLYTKDAIEAVSLALSSSWERILKSWLQIPIGVCLMLLACFGVHSLISLGSISFPASVACMIVLFISLIACDAAFGDRRMKWLVRLLDIPGGWSLRYINILFCPAFVLLPLSSPIGGVEVGKILAVFIIGYIIMAAMTAYIVRGLQLILGTSKRALVERAEELGQQGEDIPLTHTPPTAIELSVVPSAAESTASLASPVELQAPLPAQDRSLISGTGGPPISNSGDSHLLSSSLLRHTPNVLTRSQRWAAFLTTNLDTAIYTILLLCMSLPIYYTTGYAMPAQLIINILAYSAAQSLPPPKWKRFLHPVMVSSFLTVMTIWILALSRNQTFHQALQAYQTKTNYTTLLNHAFSHSSSASTPKPHLPSPSLPLPGAGDVLSSLLDVSIIALALPMFQYRHELRRQFLTTIIPSVLLSVGSLFLYPLVCKAIGISPQHSLSFASRSLTLALAIPATTNLDGDLSLVAVMCITSGMVGVLLVPTLLRVLRIPENDYITRGVTLGSSSAAIATAYLLATDPRAGAFSTLAMTLFGITMVALTSVPGVVAVVKGLVI